MHVLALVRDRDARARLQGALRGVGTLRFCERPTDLAPAVAGGGVHAVLVEPRDSAGNPMAHLVSALRTGFPRVPVVAYCDHRRDASGDILALARAGVHELVFRESDDVRTVFASVLSSAGLQCTAATILERLRDRVPPDLRSVVAYCLEHAAEPLTVSRVAAALGVHRKTLVFRLAKAHFPPPSALIGWCRILTAARLLEDEGRTVERVAMELDFPSGAALRNMLRRYTGLRPAELRERGGLRYALTLFERALSRTRDREPAPGLAGGEG